MRVQKQMAQTSNIHHLLCKCSIPLAVQWAIIMITIMKDIKYQYEVYGVKCHFQQYFSYIVVVSFIDGGNGVPGESQRSAAVASHWQTSLAILASVVWSRLFWILWSSLLILCDFCFSLWCFATLMTQTCVLFVIDKW